jgi:hypothetical protein
MTKTVKIGFTSMCHAPGASLGWETSDAALKRFEGRLMADPFSALRTQSGQPAGAKPLRLVARRRRPPSRLIVNRERQRVSAQVGLTA